MVITPRPVPSTGLASPNVGIGFVVTRVENMRRITSRDVVKVAKILIGEVGRHVMMLVSDGR